MAYVSCCAPAVSVYLHCQFVAELDVFRNMVLSKQLVHVCGHFSTGRYCIVATPVMATLNHSYTHCMRITIITHIQVKFLLTALNYSVSDSA
jgi:hypothetical protein